MNASGSGGSARTRMTRRSYLIVAALALAFGFAGAALWSLSGLGHDRTRDYLLDHPELLAEMAERYEDKLAGERVAAVAQDVVAPFPGAVLGNPEGTVTLERSERFACGGTIGVGRGGFGVGGRRDREQQGQRCGGAGHDPRAAAIASCSAS